MQTIIKIPTVRINNDDFIYHGREISNNEFNEMSYNAIVDTYNDVTNYINGRNGGFKPNNSTKTNVSDCLTYVDAEVLILDKNGTNIDADALIKYANEGKPFIIRLNFNPNSDFEAIEEIRYWSGESNMVSNNNSLTLQDKMKFLPTIEPKVVLGNDEYIMKECKIVEDNGVNDYRYPYYYTVFVKQINKCN